MKTLIHKFDELKPSHPNGKTIVYMQGYGSRQWHTKRHLRVLLSAGYHIYYFDFFDVFKRGNPNALIQLINEVDTAVELKIVNPSKAIFIGVSLGGLIGYNLLKRHEAYKRLVIITGGDITHIPSMIHLKRKWPISKETLDNLWSSINIYMEVGKLHDKSIVMILPKRDKIIDPQEVIDEINRHNKLNNIILIDTPGGHYRTIISETIGHPKRTLSYIEKVSS